MGRFAMTCPQCGTGALPIRAHELYRTVMEHAYSQGEFEIYRGLLNRLHAEKIVSVFSPHRTLFQFPDMELLHSSYAGAQFVRVFGNSMVAPRVHFARNVIAAARAEDQLAVIQRLDSGDHTTVAADVSQNKEYTASGSIVEEQLENREIMLRTSVETPQFLVLRDTFLHGWNVHINGNQVPINRVDVLFRGVEVPAGEQEIVFRYEPEWLIPARALFAGGMITLVSLSAWARAGRAPRPA